jgi:hypothetical protein
MEAASAAGRGTTGRLLPLSGAAFVVATVVAIVGLGGDTPDGSSDAAKVASYYQAHENRETVAAFVLAAAVPLLVFFGISLALAVWRGDGGRRPFWPAVLAAGSVLAGASFMLAAFIHFALADAADTVSAGTLQGLNVLDSDNWLAFNACLGVMMLGAAGSLIPRTGTYRVLGWLALLFGIALFIPFADFFALLLTGIWIIVVSVMLYRDGEPLPERGPAVA